uniref:Uncharacterized protein n=1 Tax=Arion vulgaris TaxID=1028688 RepID=A0A0B6ZSU6_9EUPU
MEISGTPGLLWSSGRTLRMKRATGQRWNRERGRIRKAEIVDVRHMMIEVALRRRVK